MNYQQHNQHVIAGQLSDEPDAALAVDAAARAAAQAFEVFSQTSLEQRAAFLNAVADQIEARAATITRVAMGETGLPEARLVGERGRTTGQLRLFAEFIRQGRHLDLRHDPALPARQPLPRPDLRLAQRPIGPVAVFGASNFPLAFSVAGGDTAAAFAAGCPVVAKAHSGHPATSEIVADAIRQAVAEAGLPAGTFSLLRTGSRTIGTALVSHPAIKAVGFTGSLSGGRALFDLCAARAEPIPFFGELGSLNPMFVFDHALENRGESIAEGWAGSITMGAGQFCTRPGVAFMSKGAAAEAFAARAAQTLANVAPQTMLTAGIAHAYHQHVASLENLSELRRLCAPGPEGRDALPSLVVISAQCWLDNPIVSEEIFGPSGILVLTDSAEQTEAIARAMQGQLTVTLQIDPADYPRAKVMMPIFERMAGRVLSNGFPTGVEVCDAMVHGGPYPASTNFGATSVGTMAIRRFLRPVCYQGLPAELLPDVFS